MPDRLAFLRLLRSAARALQRARAWAVATWRDPARRERAQAIATFAFIAAFTIVSIDYLITGGPDWNPGGEAYALEFVQPPPAPTPAPSALVLPPPPALPEILPDETDYSFTTEELLGGPEAVLAVVEPLPEAPTIAAGKPIQLAAVIAAVRKGLPD